MNNEQSAKRTSLDGDGDERNVRHIAVIGTGQIGSRHLQSLRRFPTPLSIWAVDPSDQALRTAQKRWDEITNDNDENLHQLILLNDIQSVPAQLDLAIVATGASIRPLVICQLLSVCQVKKMIVEKIVFQNERLFSSMYALFLQHNVDVWVNCPWRTFPFFQQLKTHLENSERILYHASGSHLRIGTNSIHHLDLFAHMSGEKHFRLEQDGLDDEVIQSRHLNTVEFTGTLYGSSTTGRGHFQLTSYKDGTKPLTIAIESERLHCSIAVHEQKARLALAANGWKETEVACPFYKQSEWTAVIAQQLLEEGRCSLPSYTESWPLHKSILATLLAHYEKWTKKEQESCPIT